MPVSQQPSQPTRLSRLYDFLGAAFFIGMMAVGYYYNLTFVQLGLIDLGERVLVLPRTRVAADMALLAILTAGIAIAVGWWSRRRGWGSSLRLRMRLAFAVVAVQTILTFLSLQMRSEAAFLTWLVACAAALGVGVPVTFSMTVDLVPRRWRGEAAALITAIAYLAANLLPADWSVESLARPLLWAMPPGVVALGFLSFLPWPFWGHFEQRYQDPAYSHGRYVSRHGSRRFSHSPLFAFILLMFVVFFIDSLGFLRMLETPLFMASAWQSEEIWIRAVLGITHVVGALAAGVLYDALDVRSLFYWIFGIFALVHLMYTFSLRFASQSLPLSMPVLYAMAVSIYTVVNFALWADLSTPENAGFNTAIGVAFSGWFATFISTALAVYWEANELPLDRHLNIVDSLAFLAFIAMILLALAPKQKATQV